MKKIIPILINLELVMMSVVIIVPIFWIVMSSFNGGIGLATTSFIPEEFTLDNYVRLFTETAYPNWFMNTLFIATVNSLVAVFLIMITAYTMSRFNFKGRKTMLLTILLLSMFPSFLAMTAIYNLFLVFDLVGKPISLIIVYSVGAIPYNTWLVKGYLDGVSRSIDEASYIDGCTKFQTFHKIILPMSKPIITYCAVSQFMLPWMDYILPSILLTREKSKTLAVGLMSMIDGKEATNFTLFAAGAVIIAVPITIMFIIFQKYLVQGISAGADKG